MKGEVEWREEGSRGRGNQRGEGMEMEGGRFERERASKGRGYIWSGKREGTVGGRKGIVAGRLERTEERHRHRGKKARGEGGEASAV